MGGEPSLPESLSAYRVRPIDVVLTPSLSFRLFEVKNQPDRYWSKIWPAAVATSQWLLQGPRISASTPIKELGCGPALVSLTLAHLGYEVEASDREPGALALAALNIEQSGLRGISVRFLDWAITEASPSDFLVGSDILYEPDSPPVLFELIESRGLLLPGGKLVLSASEARRHVVYELVHRLKASGYTHEETFREVSFRGRTEQISISALGRPA
ncbi:MAG: hypothetical protein HY791_19590 [Deltaproteobacteria bacterium]|nr:hypothetical protein [Deltaproteobacteria bacterium]